MTAEELTLKLHHFLATHWVQDEDTLRGPDVVPSKHITKIGLFDVGQGFEGFGLMDAEGRRYDVVITKYGPDFDPEHPEKVHAQPNMSSVCVCGKYDDDPVHEWSD
jgi:hypothetical protein